MQVNKTKQEKQFTLTFTKNGNYTINGLSTSQFKKVYKENESFFISKIEPSKNYHLPPKIKVVGVSDYIYCQAEGLIAIPKAPGNNITITLDVKEEYYLIFRNTQNVLIDGESTKKFKKVFSPGDSFEIENIKSVGKSNIKGEIKVEGTKNYSWQNNKLSIKNAPANNIFVIMGANADPYRFTVTLPRTYYPEEVIVGITSNIEEGSIYSAKWTETEIDNRPIHTYTTSTRQSLTYNVEIYFNWLPEAIGMTANPTYIAPGNKYVTSVIIPDGVERVDSFRNCINLETVKIEGSVSEAGYYKNCHKLKSINIPFGVGGITGEAFCNCRSLDELILPDSVGYIGGGAFDGCLSLGKTKEFRMSPNVREIPGAAFRDCQSLKTIDLPNCTVYESNAFSGCHSLTHIDINPGTPWIGDATFSGTFALKEIYFPASVHHMEANAFTGSGIEKVTFEEGSQMTYIRDNAFMECPNLKEFHVPAALTDISERAFVNCNLGSVTVSDYNPVFTSKDYTGECNAILIRRGEGFSLLHGSNSTVINSDYSGITEIGNWAFSGRKSITELDVTNVDELGASSFENAESINNLNFVSLDLDLNQSRFLNCFRNCKSLTNLILGKNVLHNLCEGAQNLKSVTIGEETEIIDNFAFNGCSYLESVNLNELGGLARIGHFAFGNCSSLEKAQIPSSVNHISNGAFYNSGLTLIEVAEDNYFYSDNLHGVKGAIIQRIGGESAPYPIIIQACKSTTVEDDDSYFGLASYSFAGIKYDKGTKLIMPKNTFRIDDFAYCNSTNCSVTISENVKYMGEKVFTGWKSNQTIKIPESIVEDIGGFKIAKWNNMTWSLIPTDNYYISQDCGSIEAHIEIY